MATMRDLVTGAARLLGIKGQGESLSGAEAADAIAVLNEMIDAFNSSGMLLYTTTTKVFPLSSLTQPYTIGPSGNIVASPRPTRLVGAWIRDNSTTPASDTKLLILADTDYGDIVSKGSTSTTPYAIYMDRQFPTANLYLYPQASDTSKSLVLQYLAPLDSNVTLDTVDNLPPAFRQMLRFNLAVLLAPEYGLEAPQTVQMQAAVSKMYIEQSNFQIYEMSFDSGAFGIQNGDYNIITDTRF